MIFVWIFISIIIHSVTLFVQFVSGWVPIFYFSDPKSVKIIFGLLNISLDTFKNHTWFSISHDIPVMFNAFQWLSKSFRKWKELVEATLSFTELLFHLTYVGLLVMVLRPMMNSWHSLGVVPYYNYSAYKWVHKHLYLLGQEDWNTSYVFSGIIFPKDLYETYLRTYH